MSMSSRPGDWFAQKTDKGNKNKSLHTDWQKMKWAKKGTEWTREWTEKGGYIKYNIRSKQSKACWEGFQGKKRRKQ